MRFDSYFDIFVILAIISKILFISIVLIESYFKYAKPEEEEIIELCRSIKKRFRTVFIIMMSILMAFLFNPFCNYHLLLNRESKILLYTFGLTLLIFLGWSVLFRQPRFLLAVQSSVNIENTENDKPAL